MDGLPNYWSRLRLVSAVTLLATLALAPAGCKSNGDQEILERELRWQEDGLYAQKCEINQLGMQLDACRRENDALRNQLGGGDSGPGPSSSGSSSGPESIGTPLTPRQRGVPLKVPPPPKEDMPPPFSPPKVVPITPAAPNELPTPPRSGALLPGGGGGLRQLLKGKTETPVTFDADVAKITLNPRLTGGYNADKIPGAEGVYVVIEPRDPQGSLVLVPGAVSVVLIDPALSGAAARVARWDYVADEALEHVKHTPLGEGIFLDLRWPNTPPRHQNLKLYVRFTTPDGRRFETSKDIRITLPPAGGPPQTALAVPMRGTAAPMRSAERSDGPRELIPRSISAPVAGGLRSVMRDIATITQSAPNDVGEMPAPFGRREVASNYDDPPPDFSKSGAAEVPFASAPPARVANTWRSAPPRANREPTPAVSPSRTVSNAPPPELEEPDAEDVIGNNTPAESNSPRKLDSTVRTAHRPEWSPERK